MKVYFLKDISVINIKLFHISSVYVGIELNGLKILKIIKESTKKNTFSGFFFLGQAFGRYTCQRRFPNMVKVLHVFL